MTTRAEKTSQTLNDLAVHRPKLFMGLLILCSVGTIAAAGLAVTALLSGPIGVELQKPFLSSPVSRLVALQIAASLALVLFGGFLTLVVNWQGAPKGLHVVCGAGWWRYAARSLRRQNAPQRPWLFWAGAGLAALLANVAMLVDLPVMAFIEPDTLGYLKPSAVRSAGYMLIIKAVVSISGDLKWIVPVQLNAMLAAFAVLGWTARGVLRSQAAGLMVAVAPMLSSGLLILAPTVMTEALFVALICLHLAAVLSAVQRLSWFNIGMVGLTLALMLVVRPNGISFLAGVPLLLFFFKERWRQVLTGTLGPVLLVVLAQGMAHQHTFGFFGLHKFGGISLAGAAAPLIRGDMPSAYPDLAQDLERRFKGYYVDFPPFEEREYPFEMAHVASLTAVGAIYNQILPAIRATLNLPEPQVVAFEYDPRLNAISGSLGLSAIQNDPWGFFKIVTSNYIANWHITLPVRVPMSIYYPRSLDIAQGVVEQDPQLLSQVMDLGAYQDPLLAEEIKSAGAAGIRPIEWPRLVVGVFQLALAYLAFFLSLGGVLAIFKRKAAADRTYRALAYSALVLQAGYGLISIGNASFVRYTVAFDPLVILLLTIGAVMGLRAIFADQGADSTPS